MTSLKQKRFVDTDYFHEHLDSTMVEVEGSYISATDTKIGTITDLEILGNTVQDSENLADIKSLGTDNGEGTYSYEIVTCGKNLFKPELKFGFINDSDGLNGSSTDKCIRTVDYTKVKPNTQYSAKYSGKHMDKIYYYDKSKKFISLETIYSSGKIITTPPNCEYIKLRFYNSAGILMEDIVNIQLEEGSVSTEYEEYKESRTKITLPCQLEKVGKIADRLICKDGIWCVEKNIETIVIDGSDKFGYWLATTQPPDSTLINLYVSKVLTYGKTSGILICDKFVYADSLVGGNCYTGGSGNMHFILPKTTFGDANVFKTWLQSNHTTVMYQLVQPQFIPLPKDTQIALNSFLGTTHIFFEGTEVGGTIKAKISKSVGGTLESLVEKAKITDDRLEIIENVAEGQNMQYYTDNGIIHCTNTKKGKVKDLVIEGNTLVNYAKDGSKTFTLNGEIDEKGTFITTTEGVENGLVDVAIEGETLVNVCNQKDPVAITKSYTVENTNHVPLQGEYDGKCRPVVEGRTLVNLCTSTYGKVGTGIYNVEMETIENGYGYTTLETGSATIINETAYTLKDNTVYTAVFDLNTSFKTTDENNSASLLLGFYGTSDGTNFSYGQGGVSLPGDFSNNYTRVVKTIRTTTKCSKVVIGKHTNSSTGFIRVKNLMLFEGDLTANPPTTYVEGLKSSFEDGFIPQNLVDSVNNNVSNPNLYSVLASHKNGEVKPSTTYTIYVKNKSNTLIRMYGNEHLFKDTDRNVNVNPNSYTVWKGTTVDTLPNNNALLKLGYEFNGTVNMEVMFLEGDYTSNPPTYEEVVNYGGKYKVEYKVTGKNKIDLTKIEIGAFTSTVPYEETTWQSYVKSGFIKVKPNTTYTACIPKYEDTKISYLDFRVGYYNENKVLITNRRSTNKTFTVPEGVYYIKVAHKVIDDSQGQIDPTKVSDWQLEEGTTATEYEDYKEYTKTFYLNSPLLEGDTIEDVNGKATHVKRYKQVVLNGSENWTLPTGDKWGNQTLTNAFSLLMQDAKGHTWGEYVPVELSDRFINYGDTELYNSDVEGFSADNLQGIRVFRILKSKLSSQDINGFKAWLQANPTTVVYQLASPIYETISEENILCNSYVNGHLDVNTNIPINKVDFKNLSVNMVYMQPSTPYTIQFLSDNVGVVEIHGGNKITTIDVVKGKNTVVINSKDNGNIYWNWTGIGFNASNISVVATEREFNYFEGLYSVGQDDVNGHNIEILSHNKNLFKKERYPRGSGNIVTDIQDENMRFYTSNPGMHTYIYYTFDAKPNTTYTFSVDEILVTQGNGKVNIIDVQDGESLSAESGTYGTIERSTSTTTKSSITFTTHSMVGSNNVKIGLAFYCTASSTSKHGDVTYKNVQIVEGDKVVDFTTSKSNTKTLTLNEPLRGLPNGVKDKIVKIGGKWYIERNCGELTTDVLSNNGWTIHTREDRNTVHIATVLPNVNGKIETGVNLVCNIYKSNSWASDTTNTICTSSTMDFQIGVNVNKGVYTVDSFKQYISNNNIKVVYQLQTPTYEELEVEPVLTTYVDQTNISTNSVIPCDMTVKNNGYDVIIKPSTFYTVALETSGEVELNLGGSKVTTNNGVAKILTPSTLVDDSLRISGKGLTSTNVRVLEGDNTHFIPSYFEGLKSSFEDTKQGDNHIVEVVSKDLGNIFNVPFVNKGISSTTGQLASWAEYAVTEEYIEVYSNKDYSYKADFSITTSNVFIYLYDVNKEFIKCLFFKGETQYEQTFNTGKAKFIRVGTNGSGVSKDIINSFSICKTTNITNTPQKSNKIQFSTLAPLRSVGDIKDKLVYKDNKWMIERNCGGITLDGSEDWSSYTLGAKADPRGIAFSLSVNDLKISSSSKVKGNIISDKFITEILDTLYLGVESIGVGTSSNIRICTYKSRLKTSDIEGFKLWLKENPVSVVYQLVEPYYEEIGEYRNLDSYDEETTISTNSFIAPSHLGFNLSSHISNIVKDVQDEVKDLKTWRSEVFDSITHKKTFDSGFTTVEDTKEGVVNEVKIQGKTLVNLNNVPNILVEIDGLRYYNFARRNLLANVEYTFINNTNKKVQINGVDVGVWFEINGNSITKKTFKAEVDVSKVSLIAHSNFGWTTSDTDKTMLKNGIIILEGDYTNNPPSFFEGLMSVGEDVEEMSVETIKGDGNLFNASTITEKHYLDKNTGNLVTSENFYTSDFIRCTKDTIYYHNRGEGTVICFYDKNRNYVSYIEAHPNFTSTVDGYFRIHCKYSMKHKSELMVCKRSMLNSYQPYRSDKKTLVYYNNKTQTWEKPILREWDSIEKHSDGKYYYYKRSEKVVLNGSEDNWTQGNSNGVPLFYLNIGNHVGSLTQPHICNRFKDTQNYSLLQTTEYGMYSNSTNLYFRPPFTITNLNEFKTWLVDNNVEVVYKLEQEEVYEVANIDLNSYDGETNIIVNSGAISPITTVSLTSSLPQVAENLRNRVKQLEEQMYDYQVVQNLRQLRTFYKSDYANFGIAVVTNTLAVTSSEDITPYGYDLFELFKQIIEEGKDSYDRIELEEYIDFYVMTFIFNYEMAFELFDLIASQHPHSEIEEEEPTIKEEEDLEIDVEMGVIPEEIDPEMGVIPQEPSDEDFEIDVEMGVEHEDFEIDVEMGVVPLEPNKEDLED